MKKEVTKRTEWYPVAIKPERVGYYEVQGRDHWPQHINKLYGHSRRYWDGQWWRGWDDGFRSTFGEHESHQWRGLASNPNARKA